ncbi:MAG: oligosaccharide repeat unit polymerase [Prevotella sp.]|nr:oligosaccharide repeat unit polymerase [Prevotella sp.]
MLTYIIILITLFAAIVLLSLLKRYEIMAPWAITPIVWGVILFIYIFARKELYAMVPDFLNGLLLWVTGLCAASFITFKITPAYKHSQWQACEKNIDILTGLAIILVPLAVYKAIQHAMMMASPEELMMSLREQAIDPEENQLGVVKYFVYIINVLLILELDRLKIRKWRLSMIIMLCFLFFVATMSKTTLLTYIFSGLYILYSNKKISLKPIFFFALFLIAMVPIMYVMRSSGDGPETDSDTITSLLIIYIVSSVIAFGYLTPCSTAQWGEITLRPFYNILHGLGFDVNVVTTIQDFVYVPLPTNVYTCMAPFYQDFGLPGIFVFAVIEGAIIGVIYKYAKTGFNIMKYLYAFIFTMLITQFFDENFFQAISAIIQTLLMLIICHTKFIINKKTDTCTL